MDNFKWYDTRVTGVLKGAERREQKKIFEEAMANIFQMWCKL